MRDVLIIFGCLIIIAILPVLYLGKSEVDDSVRYDVSCVLAATAIFDFPNARAVHRYANSTQVVDYQGVIHTFGPGACYTMMKTKEFKYE